MPSRDLTGDRVKMRALTGKADALPSYSGPSRPGLPAFLWWLLTRKWAAPWPPDKQEHSS